MPRMLLNSLLALAVAGMALTGYVKSVKAQVAGPGVGGGGFGGGAGGAAIAGGGGGGGVPAMVPGGPMCIPLGGKIVCFFPKRPRPRMTGTTCCWQRVVKKRMRVLGKMQTVYVDKGRTCRPATDIRHCERLARRR